MIISSVALLAGGLAVIPVLHAGAAQVGTSSATDTAAADLARMRQQRPLADAASQIQRAVDTGHFPGYSSLVLEANQVALYWKDTVPAALSAIVQTARRTAPVEVKSAAFSRAELQTAAKKIRAAVPVGLDRAVHHVYLNPDGSGLTLAEGGAVGVQPLSTAALPRVDVPVSVLKQATPKLVSRKNDSAPWSGGASIWNQTGGSLCTAGFGVKNSAGQQFILTAAHCGSTGDHFADAQGESIGNVTNRNETDDIELIAASSVSNRIYVGGNDSSQQLTVDRWDYVHVGEFVCQSGNTSAEKVGSQVCNQKVTAVDDDGIMVTDQQDGQEAARPGDSGGPVYVDLGNGHVVAKGTTTWVSGSSLGFHPVSQASRDYGVDVVGSTGTPPPPGGAGALVALGKCADVTAANANDGTAIIVWDCNGATNQQWSVGANDSLRVLGKCLDVNGAGTANNTKVILWTCHGGVNQSWQQQSNGSFRNPASGRCLDIPGADTTNGTQLILWDCNGTANQSWKLG